MSEVTAPLLRYHGAKFRLAPWIMSFFPAHRTYVEPFGGAGGVLLQKARSYAEVYNDLDDDVVNFFRVVRDPELRTELVESLVSTPYARREFELAWLPVRDTIERARRLAIRAQMGFGSAGATKGSTGFRIDTKRTYETAQHCWAQCPAAIEAAGRRLSGVLIENVPATQLLSQHDGPDTLFFVDPPYVHSTRVRGAGKARGYRHEMSDLDHEQLLAALKSLQGMVVLSGYLSDLYCDHLVGWQMHQTDARISAGRGTTVRREIVWINRACQQGLDAMTGSLFDSCKV